MPDRPGPEPTPAGEPQPRVTRKNAGRLPEHVGLIMDGNRRWARQAGMANPGQGHHAGAEHAEQVLSWCEAVSIKNVTIFICSTENLRHRDDARWHTRCG